MSDEYNRMDMSDADSFTQSRLLDIIYGSKLEGNEAKLLARFMHDAKVFHESQKITAVHK